MDYEYLRASDGTGKTAKANIQTNRAVGSTVLDVDSVAKWPTKFICTTGTIGANGYMVESTMTEFRGRVVAGDIIIDSFEPGFTDVGNTAEQVAIVKQTTSWANSVVNGAKVTHNDDGTLKTGIVTTAKIADANVTAPKLATDAITLGYAQATAIQVVSSTTATDLTGLSATVTVPAGGRRCKITGYIPYAISGAADNAITLRIVEGATVLSFTRINVTLNKATGALVSMYLTVPTSGSHTYKLSVVNDLTSGVDYFMSTTAPGFILVELI